MRDPAAIPDFLAHLPVVSGLPVPWVAIWTGEMAPVGVEVTEDLQLIGTDSNSIVWHGILWINVNDPGNGLPDFGSTSSARQRAGMLDGICQVCGKPGADVWTVVDDTDRTDGLIGQVELWQQHSLVINPPLHEDCYQAALTLCPHLLRHPVTAVIRGASARAEQFHGTAPTGEEVLAPLDHPAASRIMGRQLIVSLWRGDERVFA